MDAVPYERMLGRPGVWLLIGDRGHGQADPCRVINCDDGMPHLFDSRKEDRGTWIEDSFYWYRQATGERTSDFKFGGKRKPIGGASSKILLLEEMRP